MHKTGQARHHQQHNARSWEMLYVHEKIAKLGGVYLGGQVSSVEIQEAANIHIAQDDKGEVKKTQPEGARTDKGEAFCHCQ